MGDAKARAERGDHVRFALRFGPQAVVDGRCLNLAGAGRRCKEQEREAVRPTGNGEAKPLARREQRSEIGAESVNQGGVGLHPPPLAH